MVVLFEDKVEITSNCKPSTFEYRGWAFLKFSIANTPIFFKDKNILVILFFTFQKFNSDKSTLQEMGIRYTEPYMEKINSPMTYKEFIDTIEVAAVVIAVILLIIITA